METQQADGQKAVDRILNILLAVAAPDPMALYRLDHGKPPFMRSAAAQPARSPIP